MSANLFGVIDSDPLKTSTKPGPNLRIKRDEQTPARCWDCNGGKLDNGDPCPACNGGAGKGGVSPAPVAVPAAPVAQREAYAKAKAEVHPNLTGAIASALRNAPNGLTRDGILSAVRVNRPQTKDSSICQPLADLVDTKFVIDSGEKDHGQTIWRHAHKPGATP